MLKLRVLCVVFLIFYTGIAYAKDEVTVTVFEDHARYVSASSSYGLSWLLLEAAAEKANIELVVIPSSWNASMKRLQSGKVDLVFAALKTKEREKWATFSLPLIAEGSAIFTHPKNSVNHFDEIDLQNSTIGVPAKSIHEELSRELGFENIYPTAQRPQLYDMLDAGRIDYLFLGESIIDYYCLFVDGAQNRDCMKKIEPIFHADSVHTIVLKTNKEAQVYLNRLNQSLFNMRDAKNIKALFNKYPDAHETHAQWVAKIEAVKSTL
ncbi:substrate-binding periplasmic protein [Alteromonas facilis]|uniref:substrate-binding periplasmic protein n=1 Tax=Alteromonas facilis TaxID=2048004 RepID=UPI0013D92928|nr:transporter substrate-binding domain-containing protein [Alteromonas facilis]